MNLMIMDQDMTFQAVVKEAGRKFTDKHAFSFVDEEDYTYGQVLDHIESMIAFFEKLGLQQNDKIALISTNSPNWVITYFAATYMGAVIVPVLPDFSKLEVLNILEHCEAKAVIISDTHYANIKEDYPNCLESIISIDDFSLLKSASTNTKYQTGQKPAKTYNVKASDLAAIIYTSGTTGRSKGVMLSHRNIISNAHAARKLKYVDHTDRFLSILPLAHTLENTTGMVVPFISGASIYYLRKPPIASVLLPALQKVKPTFILIVPLIIEKIFYNKIKPAFYKSPIIRALYNIKAFRKIFSRAAGKKLLNSFGGEIKFFGIGGAKLSQEVEQFLLDAKFPYAIGYGLTESSPIIAGMMQPDCILGSTGTTIENVEVKLNNPNPATGEGEVWAKGPNIMMGYYKDPKTTAEVLTEDGWLKTGDLATINNKGFISIKGRSKNVIIGSSGENIYPEEIESVINNFKHVLESLVLHKGGKLVAMVHINREELEEKYKHLKEEMTRVVEEKMNEIITELTKQVNQRLNKFSRVQQFVLQPVPFQRTATKKIKRYLYV